MSARSAARAHRRTLALSLEGVDQLRLFGLGDENLRAIEEATGCRVNVRNERALLAGQEGQVDQASHVLMGLVERVHLGEEVTPEDVRALAAQAQAQVESAGGVAAPAALGERRIYLSGRQRVVRAKTAGQQTYMDAMEENDVVVSIGPAGTGKTYLAVAMAVDFLNKKRVKRIVLCRPAVEAGESLGFLPGDLQEKVDPYLRPLYDALYDMLPPDNVKRAVDMRIIEIAPLAYLRGRTLNDAFIILDEAQNTTSKQMKMFLTRLGLSSRVVITGDKTQTDLSNRAESGLLEIEELLRGIDGISIIYLTEHDVVRHRLVQDIIRAYERKQG